MRIGSRMDAPLAAPALGELEVLHRIRRIDLRRLEPRVRNRPIQQLPRRSDKRLTPPILNIARLLPNKSNSCGYRPPRKHRLSGLLVKMTPTTVARSATEPLKIRGGRNELSSAHERSAESGSDACAGVALASRASPASEPSVATERMR